MSEELFNNKFSWKSPAIALKILVLLILAVIILGAIFRERFVTPPNWQVSVIGRGEVVYTPDIAKINVGIQVDKAYAADVALKRLNETADKTIAAISQLGIAKEDIQTQNYSLYPEYNYVENNSILAGYSANQQLIITVRNIFESADLVSKVIAAATSSGANQINNVSFESSNIENLKQEARVKAISDAKSKANELAVAAGVKLGKTIGWWENFIQSPDVYSYYDGKGAGGAVGLGGGQANVPSGAYTLIVDMNLSYQVK